jgi:prepilin-type processing-associated H-X9-DG protein
LAFPAVSFSARLEFVMKRHAGLTLSEVVTVVACVGLLLALLLPVIQYQRGQARLKQCANNLKQMGLGIHNYHDTFKVIPPAGTASLRDKVVTHSPMVSWQVRIMPFMDQTRLYEHLNMRSTDVVASIVPQVKEPKALAESHQVPYARCPVDMSEIYAPGWSSLGTEEAGLRIQKGGVSGLAAQGSYCGNLGAQLTSAEPDSRATACDQYNKARTEQGVGNFDLVHGSIPYGFAKGAVVNPVEEPNTSKGLDRENLSGLFSENMFSLGFAQIQDGTSNTFMVGEVLGNCTGDRTRLGWWHYQDYTNARASVSVPLNIFTTCVESKMEAENLEYLHPDCAPIAHAMNSTTQLSAANLTWGFRSMHPEGANFLFADGSVQFIKSDIDYDIYQAMGGRNDELPVRK